MSNDIILYKNGELELSVAVTPDKETVWLTQKQMGLLFGVKHNTLSEHIKNIFKEKELDERTSVGISDKSLGGRPPKIYNLDVIISIGYRVKSKEGVKFRKWATSILKQYMIQGYALNEKRLESMKKVIRIESNIIADMMDIEVEDVLKVVNTYAEGLSLLDDYDHQCVKKPDSKLPVIHEMTYEECREVIHELEYHSDVFGVEKEQGKLKGILAAVHQNVFGQEVYPTLEEKAATLLYFLIKDHPFADGCKRIAAAVFLQYLNQNHALIQNDKQVISNSALVAITLLVAQSNPEEKDIMIDLIMNFIDLSGE